MAGDDDRDLVVRAFGGVLSDFRAIQRWGPARFAAATRGSDFVIEPGHVSRVLTDLLEGRADLPLVRQWADAVFWDVLTLDGGAVDISVTYQPEHEDVIAETVVRLQELGDRVDGDLRPGEGEQLLAALRVAP